MSSNASQCIQLPLSAHFTHPGDMFLWTRYQPGCIQKHVVTKINYGDGDMLLKTTNYGGRGRNIPNHPTIT